MSKGNGFEFNAFKSALIDYRDIGMKTIVYLREILKALKIWVKRLD